MALATGTLVWIRHPEYIWVPGEVSSEGEGPSMLKIKNEEGEVLNVNFHNVCLRNQDQYSSQGLIGLDDLTELTHLHEAAILHSLQVRFDVDTIYTFTGPILIAINPFKTISALYDDHIVSQIQSIENLPSHTNNIMPHVYSVAMRARRRLRSEEVDAKCRNQTILISGESGAGKTESTKYVMRYLATPLSGQTNTTSSIADQVLSSNPLLEAFGNARTLRNDNSSRFGKFIAINFTKDLDIAGANISTYLLEKIRVSEQAQGERNFHIFYQLCAAATNSKIKGDYREIPIPNALNIDSIKLPKCLRDHSYYSILTKTTSTYVLDQEIEYHEKLLDVKKKKKSFISCDLLDFYQTVIAMERIGLSSNEIEEIFKIVTACLLIGNCEFESKLFNTSDEATFLKNSPNFVQDICNLLSISEWAENTSDIEKDKSLPITIPTFNTKFEEVLTTKLIKTKYETYRSPLEVNLADANKLAFCRHLFNMLFSYVVNKANKGMGNQSKDFNRVVGVLDIFGFECFITNSFEQLCINFTNERLQNFFNLFVFKLEETLYFEEGISWNPLDFPDNEDIVVLIGGDGKKGPPNVLSLLDEECNIPGGNDRNLVAKYFKHFYSDNERATKLSRDERKHCRFNSVATSAQVHFVIEHFAGDVTYDSTNFCQKNNDRVSEELLSILSVSKSSILLDVVKEFQSSKPNNDKNTRKSIGGGDRGTTTVSSEFKNQLNELIRDIRETDPHFIRCIKPNPQNLSDIYDRPSVTEQLRYGGVLQAVQVSRAGYPVRMSHSAAVSDLSILIIDYLKFEQIIDSGELRFSKKKDRHDIFQKTRNSFLQTAKSIDLKSKHPEKICSQILDFIYKIYYTTDETKNEYNYAVGKSLLFYKQDFFEKIQSLRQTILHESSSTIRAIFLGIKQRKKYQIIQSAILSIQCAIRCKIAKNKHRIALENFYAIKVISFMKMMTCRQSFLKKKRAVFTFSKYYLKLLEKRAILANEKINASIKITAFFKGIVTRRQIRRLKNDLFKLQKFLKYRAAQKIHSKLQNEKTNVETLHAKFNENIESLRIAQSTNDELMSVNYSLKSEIDKLNRHNISLVEEITGLKASLSLAMSNTSTREEIEGLEKQIEKLTEELKNSKLEHSALTVKIEELVKNEEALKLAVKVAESKYSSLLKSSSTGIQRITIIDFVKFDHVSEVWLHQRPIDLLFLSPTTEESPKNITTKTLLLTNTIDKLSNNLSNYEEVKSLIDHDKILNHLKLELNEETSPVSTLSIIDVHSPHSQNGLLAVTEWLEKTKVVVLTFNFSKGKVEWPNIQSFIEVNSIKKSFFILVACIVGEEEANDGFDITIYKDYCSQRNICTVEVGHDWSIVFNSILSDLRLFWTTLKKQQEETTTTPVNKSSPPKQASPLSSAYESVRGWFQTSGAGNPATLQKPLLLSSIRATSKKLQRVAANASESIDLIKPVQELQDSECAVTCVIFGQERIRADYILLAAASKDGTIVIYRCYRTEMEKERYVMSGGVNDTITDNSANTSIHGDYSNIGVHSRLIGHTRAVTCIFFNLLEDQLVSTSIDKSVRFWSVESGEMLKVFTDSSPVPVAIFLPFNPSVFIAANSNAVLRLVNVTNGVVLQKLKIETEVRALRFDDTGLFLLAGTKSGSIHVLEASDNSTLKFKFKLQLARGGITSIAFVSETESNPACLCVNTADSSITIVDCTYGPPIGVLTNLVVRHRLKVAHSLLPLKSTLTPFSEYIISGSEDKDVYAYSLQSGCNYKLHCLKHHVVPVVCVAVNTLETLLVSADSLGRIVLWRRLEVKQNEA